MNFRWIALSTDHIVILTLLLALVAKFILFENKEELNEELRAQMIQEEKKCDHIVNGFVENIPCLKEKECAFSLILDDSEEGRTR